MTGPAVTGERALRGLVRAAPGLTMLAGGQTGVDTYAALAAAEAHPGPHPGQMFDHVYAEEPARVSSQRRAASAVEQEGTS